LLHEKTSLLKKDKLIDNCNTMNTMIQKLHIFLSACLVGTLLAAQTPTITGFTPAAGSIGATVTLTGTNFNPTATNNIVHFGAVKATVSSASPTSLTVTVPLGATYKPITVLNTVTGLSAASAKPFLVTFSGGLTINAMSFATKTDFTTASQPRSVASGDLDGDGKPELIAANNGSANVSLLKNNSSSGTLAFATKVDLTTGAGPSCVAVGDLDGDGKLDLAIGNQFSNTVSILRNTSTGGMLSLAAKIDSAVGSGPLGVAIGDLDGDGKPDLALANFSSSTVSVLRNTSTVGSISFARKVDFITGTNSRPYNIGLGDIDGDGKLDLVAPNAFASNVSVIRNTSTPGNLSFAGRVDFTTGDTPSGVAIGDLDGDGKPDIAISNLFSTSVSVFRNTSKVDTVALAAKVDFTTGATPFSVSMGDLDGDGKLDLTVANSGSSSLSVLRNTSSSGTLSFVAKVDLAVGSEPNIASIGDLDGDGKPDLATTNLRGNSVSVLRNQLTLPPSIISFNPTTGRTGDTILITGIGFTGATKVNFGDSTASFIQVVSSTLIKAVVSDGATGKVDVFIPGDTLSLAGFTYISCPTPTLSITVSPNDTFCLGDSLTFTALAMNAGSSFKYQWRLNRQNVGTNSPTYIVDTLSNLDTVSCLLIDTCTTVFSISSNSIAVVVRSPATLSSTLTPPPVCSGTTFAYTPTSSAMGTTFSWRRKARPGISNPAANGTGPINETLIDTTANPVVVTYEYFNLSVGGCIGSDTFRVMVTVNPRPVLTSPLDTLMQCTGVSFTYTPSSSTVGATLGWSRSLVNGVSNSGTMGTGNITETLNNTTNAPVNVTYVFSLTANGCTNLVPANLVVRVKPVPVFTGSTTAPGICSGATLSYVPTSNTPGATFNWTRAAVMGISNSARTDTGRINEALSNTTANPINVVYQYTATANGCTSPTPTNVTVIVNPSATLSSTLTPPAICSGTAFMYTPTSTNTNATFSWTRALVNGLSNAAASGTAGINETLINTTADTLSVVYLYTISATGCSDPNPTRVTVLVKPRPVLSSATNPPAICSGSAFSYTPTSATEGTTFSWTRAAVAGISNAAANGTGNPNETLFDTTTGPVTVTYLYTLSAYGCTNPIPDTVKVVVNRPPSLSSSTTPADVCSGALFSYIPTSTTVGTTFSWTRAAVTGISNAAANGTDDPLESLINTSNAPVSVTYAYTLNANGCINPQIFNVVVVVKPSPTLSSSLTPPAICSGNVFNYTPTSAATGASFAWIRASVNGISNPEADGVGNPNETLVNTTAAAINVIYRFTVSAGGCTNPTARNVVVLVNPSPRLTSDTTIASICSGTTVSYTPRSNVINTTFTWTRAAVQGISNPASASNNSPDEILVNTTEFPIGVIYLYTLSANGCANANPTRVRVTVNPLPSLSSSTIAPDICSGGVFSYLPKSSTSGTSFAWTRAAVNGISTPAANGTGNPGETLTNTTNAPITVVYAYRLSANGCDNLTVFNVEVEVSPLPMLSSTSTPPAICSGMMFNYSPSSSVANTTFSWTRAAVNGISNLAASGTGNPNEILSNTTAAPIQVTYVYTLNVEDCINPNTFTVTVTVNPQPRLNSTLDPAPICSGTAFVYTPSSSTTGTSFSWTRAAVNGISNAPGTGTGNINEILVTSTAAPINVTYVYTLSANGCASTINNTFVVTVNPLPTLNSELALDASCSGSSFTYIPGSTANATNFTWTRAAVAGISNLAANGTGSITEALNNTTSNTLNVAYVYTLSANGCSNPSSFTVTKSISPLPALNSSLSPDAICSASTFSYTPSSSVSGTLFTWTRAALSGISNAVANGTGSVNETLTNTTSGALNVTYQYSLSANGCTNPSNFQVNVTVNPKPTLITNNPAPRCTTLVDLRATAITAGSTEGLTFSYWTDAAATQAFTTPQSTDAGIYYIKGTNANTGCFDIKPVTVVIGKIPDATATGKTICSGIPVGITVLNPNAAPGATFNWTATYGNARKGRSSGVGVPFGQDAINEILINLTRKGTEVVYTITPIGSQQAGCEGEPITVKVKVNRIGKCPEAEPTAFSETIANNTAPQTKVNMVKPKKRKKYLVQAISNPDSVDGVSEAPYTRPRGSTFEEGLLKNRLRTPSTVVYTIVPYTKGRNWRDNNGTQDDVLGASFEVTVVVQPGPGLVGEVLPEIAVAPQMDAPFKTLQNPAIVRENPQAKAINPALLDYFVEAEQKHQTEKVVLLQNVPNPFQESTQIGFYLPEAAEARLTLRDVKGAVLYQLKGAYAKGWNLLELNSAQLQSSGVLYYSLETAKFVETKRMVVLKQ